MELWSGFAMIVQLRLRMQFELTTFGVCRHWGSLEVAGLEKLVGSAVQMILVSPVAEIVGIARAESDL